MKHDVSEAGCTSVFRQGKHLKWRILSIELFTVAGSKQSSILGAFLALRRKHNRLPKRRNSLKFRWWTKSPPTPQKKMMSAPEPTDMYKRFKITNLMHNFFIFQRYICYITLLNMFRAARCSSSGGPIVLPQLLVSSPSVNSRTVCRLRADCSPLSTRILYSCLQRVTIPEAVVIQLALLMMSSVLLETCWGA